jgi:hypothetical protein
MHYTKSKKPNTKDNVLYNSIIMIGWKYKIIEIMTHQIKRGRLQRDTGKIGVMHISIMVAVILFIYQNL